MKTFEIKTIEGSLFGRRYSAETKQDAVAKALTDFPEYEEDELYAIDDTPEQNSIHMSPSFKNLLEGWSKTIKEQQK